MMVILFLWAGMKCGAVAYGRWGYAVAAFSGLPEAASMQSTVRRSR